MTSAAFHNQVTLDKSPKLDWRLTVKLNSAIVKADEGKALSWDGTTANQLKLAADGDTIVARLVFVEADSFSSVATGFGTVDFKFIDELPKSGSIAVGDSVQGAGSGAVKTLTTDVSLNIVVEVRTSTVVVMKA